MEFWEEDYSNEEFIIFFTDRENNLIHSERKLFGERAVIQRVLYYTKDENKMIVGIINIKDLENKNINKMDLNDLSLIPQYFFKIIGYDIKLVKQKILI